MAGLFPGSGERNTLMHTTDRQNFLIQCSYYKMIRNSVVDPNTLNLDPNTLNLDPNTLNLDPDPGFWPNLDPDPGPDPG